MSRWIKKHKQILGIIIAVLLAILMVSGPILMFFAV